ncbi:MAG: DUF3847 domain-containing protein [Oscillospiraceae bacterium]|nr:DUF3847 domain-containing protein [Oscillospiraceae bacterium]
MPENKIPIEEQIANVRTEIRQNENRINELLQKKNVMERKTRTRRLIERGAILESLIDGAANLTNEQIKTLLQSVLCTISVREMVVTFLKKNAKNDDET